MAMPAVQRRDGVDVSQAFCDRVGLATKSAIIAEWAQLETAAGRDFKGHESPFAEIVIPVDVWYTMTRAEYDRVVRAGNADDAEDVLFDSQIERLNAAFNPRTDVLNELIRDVARGGKQPTFADVEVRLARWRSDRLLRDLSESEIGTLEKLVEFFRFNPASYAAYGGAGSIGVRSRIRFERGDARHIDVDPVAQKWRNANSTGGRATTNLFRYILQDAGFARFHPPFAPTDAQYMRPDRMHFIVTPHLATGRSRLRGIANLAYNIESRGTQTTASGVLVRGVDDIQPALTVIVDTRVWGDSTNPAVRAAGKPHPALALDPSSNVNRSYAVQYNGGATAVHEVGHALGMSHTFASADDCSGGSRNDYMADTPVPRSTAATLRKPLTIFAKQRSYDPAVVDIAACGSTKAAPVASMVQNFMDYELLDESSVTFSRSQIAFTHWLLHNSQLCAQERAARAARGERETVSILPYTAAGAARYGDGSYRPLEGLDLDPILGSNSISIAVGGGGGGKAVTGASFRCCAAAAGGPSHPQQKKEQQQKKDQKQEQLLPPAELLDDNGGVEEQTFASFIDGIRAMMQDDGVRLFEVLFDGGPEAYAAGVAQGLHPLTVFAWFEDSMYNSISQLGNALSRKRLDLGYMCFVVTLTTQLNFELSINDFEVISRPDDDVLRREIDQAIDFCIESIDFDGGFVLDGFFPSERFNGDDGEENLPHIEDFVDFLIDGFSLEDFLFELGIVPQFQLE